jgi:hypothetical protein
MYPSGASTPSGHIDGTKDDGNPIPANRTSNFSLVFSNNLPGDDEMTFKFNLKNLTIEHSILKKFTLTTENPKIIAHVRDTKTGFVTEGDGGIVDQADKKLPFFPGT